MTNQWPATVKGFVTLGIAALCAFVGIRVLYLSLRGVRTGVLELGHGAGTVRGSRAVVLGWIYAVFALVPLLAAFILFANGIRLIRS